MLKTMFTVAALALAAAGPAAAQMAAAPAAAPPAAMPKCSATVRDSCDQSMTTERYAMSAEAAMKSGGVGDRASDNAAKAMPAGHMMMGKKHMMMHHKHMMNHHHMMKAMDNNPETKSMAPADAAKPM